MNRFFNVFSYESTNFDGRYRNCKLLMDVPLSKCEGHIYALSGETFPLIIVDMNTSDMYFFEEFDDHVPVFVTRIQVKFN